MHVESRLNLSSKGFDIFNPNDPFYNGVCAPFDINNKDVLLSQRRKLFYKNLSLCNNNCEYKKFAMIITQLIVNAKEILCQRPFSQNKLIK